MSREDLNAINRSSAVISDDLDFSRNIVKLHNFGWNEFIIPRCYGASFGAEKACLYMEMPDNLAKEQHGEWFETVIKLYCSDASYQHIAKSKKYANKPCFIAFSLTADALEKMSYSGKNLPTVIALGDAQIDSDYFLGNGIYGGIFRIDALLTAMTIVNGEIHSFDQNVYMDAIEGFLVEHKNAITESAVKTKDSFISARASAKPRLECALNLTNNPSEKNDFIKLLKKLNHGLKLRVEYLIKR